MLERLDKSYLREAAIYFHHIIIHEEHVVQNEPPTLLHFACNEDSAWAHIGQQSTTHFQTSDFQETCHNIEIRILSRCAGLVDIDEFRLKSVDWFDSAQCDISINQDEDCVSRYLREVKFIHKTARDYVQNSFKSFKDSNCRKGT